MSAEPFLGPEASRRSTGAAIETSADLLVGPGFVVTPQEVLPDAGVLIRGGRIAAVGRFDEIRRRVPATPAPEHLDARGGLILPGLVNAHSHFYSALARGIPLRDEPPADFVETLERLWWRLDRALTPEDIRTSAMVALAECVRCGVTSVVDHHASPNACEGSLDLIRAAVETSGLRAALCYEVSDRDGPEHALAAIAENVRFIRSLNEEPSDRVAALFGMHALFTLSDETLERCVAAARAERVGVHLHVAEDRADVEHSLEVHGERPVERLVRHGALDEQAVVAHCVHVDESEIDLLGRSGAFVVHNPESNMNNAVGCAPVVELLARGVRVGLGSDGMSGDILATARSAFLLQHHSTGDPRVGWSELPALLWENGAWLASNLFGQTIGVISTGAAGDLIVLDYDPATPLHAENLTAHLLFGFSARHVVATVVAGRVLMRERCLLTLDATAVRASAREQARSLWERF
jgi:putative selenium metabolism protein SsnA